jgi:2-desacetyl-2-hydroxyethyl bacteriochlorophyllide A dehydrogenase
MRAFVVSGPFTASVEIVPDPTPLAGEVLIDVTRAGICGTDVELFDGSMDYLRQGIAEYPLRLGHEWCGIVSAVGDGVDSGWLGQFVTGDTMLGCRHCERCLDGRQHLCESRRELGLRGAVGALAERVVVPATSLISLPDTMSPDAAAMIEPAGNAYRAVEAALMRGAREMLIIGPGTVGLLAAMFARAEGVAVTLMGNSDESLHTARRLGFTDLVKWTDSRPPQYSSVIDASNSPEAPARAVQLAEPGGTVALIGLSGDASLIDTRSVVFADLLVTGIMSASPGLAHAARAFADGTVDPTPLIGAVLPLASSGAALAGHIGRSATSGPKILIDPRA